LIGQDVIYGQDRLQHCLKNVYRNYPLCVFIVHKFSWTNI